ncbi:DUF3253 domain-containing protein [Mycolicibacterium sp. BiH015]|uniref:DUF3253 domain-containing protein n=1 Tax=Mycolicibacterium sp. BiH015 TaxID=3018808 RepID=UPI0022E79ED2|nr:DUF3253 domain-containing protein [Mycolicibacterium sp. BiH015]MDA2890661.1 DUF3253 domain-containing protein [Mycolicibacterium sp. BiH015]
MAERLHVELTRIAAGGGPGAAAARRALGEGPIRRRLEAAIWALAEHRGPDSSTCPSDAARAVGGAQWRGLMDDARALARELATAGAVEITQGGKVVDPEGQWRGPIRIRKRA